MREFIDDELERTMMWREDRWCVVVGMIDRETGDFFAFSWKREGWEGWRELRHGIQKISFYWRISRQTHL